MHVWLTRSESSPRLLPPRLRLVCLVHINSLWWYHNITSYIISSLLSVYLTTENEHQHPIKQSYIFLYINTNCQTQHWRKSTRTLAFTYWKWERISTLMKMDIPSDITAENTTMLLDRQRPHISWDNRKKVWTEKMITWSLTKVSSYPDHCKSSSESH